MSSLLSQCAVVAIPLFGLPFFATNAYLSFKLRKNKQYLISEIARNAPEKIRETAIFAMESHMSWVFSSAASYIWFTYLILRYLGRIPKIELIQWQLSIKSLMAGYYKIYWVSNMLANIASFSATIFIVNEFLLPTPL